MKPQKDSKSVILLLDQTFGTLKFDSRKRSRRLVGIDLMPSTAKALDQFTASNVRVFLLVPERLPAKSLQDLKRFLPAVNEIITFKQDVKKTLAYCARRHWATSKKAIFVAADRTLRGAAAGHGYAAAPHPAIAALIVRGHSCEFVRVIGDREHFERISEVVPYFWEFTESGTACLLAVMSRAAIAEVIARNLRVEVLPLDISTEDPLFIQLDTFDEKITKELRRQKVLFVEDRRMLVAMGPSEFNDSPAIHGPHGHFQFLMPNPELLKPADFSSGARRKARLALGQWPLEKLKGAEIAVTIDIMDLILKKCPSTAASFQQDVDRYSGASDLDCSGPIVSRHIQHPDNSNVVQALIDDLNDMGYCAYTHTFNFAGMTLKNVIADLPGTGCLSVDPNILDRILDIMEQVRDIFLKYPFPDPPDPWVKDITRLLGNKWFKAQKLGALSPPRLRSVLETIFELKPWFPWWLKLCPLAGPGAEIVIVGCHLDSTAANESGYNPITDPAPGADDDASGIAASLAIARYMANFRGKLKHTVRFCFFNAEESGMVGSKAYATMLKAAGAPIRAVVCTDMIGYNSDAARIFEIHAGYTDPAVRDISVPIADAIAAWAASQGVLSPAQIYKGTSPAGGSDRNLVDGAINRSDHAAFHQQGYPAVVVSEDFFANLATEPGADPNPNYHEADDTTIDSAFGSDITCAVAFAVKELAGG
jgi:hypothetical protein